MVAAVRAAWILGLLVLAAGCGSGGGEQATSATAALSTTSAPVMRTLAPSTSEAQTTTTSAPTFELAADLAAVLAQKGLGCEDFKALEFTSDSAISYGECTALGLPLQLYVAQDRAHLEDFISGELGASCATATVTGTPDITSFRLVIGDGWYVADLKGSAWATTPADPDNGKVEVQRIADASGGQAGHADCAQRG